MVLASQMDFTNAGDIWGILNGIGVHVGILPRSS